MLGKFVLWLSAVSFVGYGIACLISPEYPAGLAGLQIVNGDGYSEMGAMYGGLQTGFGLFCLLAALNAAYYRPALAMLTLVIGSLALGRLISTLTGTGEIGIYTWGAMGFEFFITILSALAFKATAQTH